MGAESGRTDRPLSRTLFDEAYRFEVFQAVRLLERSDPTRRPVGRDGDPAREVVRFRTRPSLAFPPSQVDRLAGASVDADGPPEMTVAFMGLTGPLGVLPPPYTELLIDRSRSRDTAMWEFFDLFNHRMISLFVRAWEKYRFPVAYERGEDDQFTEALLNGVGMGGRALRNRLSFGDEALVYYGGQVAQRPHSASAIAAVLGDFFGAPVRIEQFSGQWLSLDDESRSRLGSANNRLGMDTIAGSRVWDTQSRFRLRVGPLSFKRFQAFLPVGDDYAPVRDFARFLVGMELDFDLQLVLEATEVPACAPTSLGHGGPRLGWTTWLKTREFVEDDSQVILNIERPYERES